MRIHAVFLQITLLSLLAGCSALPFGDRFGKSAEEKRAAEDAQALAVKPEVPATKLLNAGIRNLNTGDNEKAQKAFSELGEQHPFSKEAERSLVLSAYSHFTEGEYDETVSKAQRYIQLYPGNDDAAYMQYLIAESHFKQISSVLLDQEETRKGLRAYTNLVRLYPASKFVEASKAKIIFMNDQLAGKEMQVGRYYQEKNQHLAAVNRFRGVAEDFQETRHVEEALFRLTESYLALGIVNEAQTAGALLGYNYPDSSWYKDAYSLLTGQSLTPRVNRESMLSRILPFGGKRKDDKDEKQNEEASTVDATRPVSPAVGSSVAVVKAATPNEQAVGVDDVETVTAEQPQLTFDDEASSISRQAAAELVKADNEQAKQSEVLDADKDEEKPEKRGFLSKIAPFSGNRDK